MVGDARRTRAGGEEFVRVRQALRRAPPSARPRSRARRSTDGNGIAYSRSPGQVLNIVYLTPKAATSGGFFPQGVNGEVNTSARSS